MRDVHLEVVLAAGYALFLLATAFVLEWAARHTHARAQMYRHRGFRFHRHLDVWECPAGEHLARRETDHARRLVRYRARAEKCNSCALKALCTDSDAGREVVHSTEDWVDTQVGRFHRGLSLTLLGLAALTLVAVALRHHRPAESAALAAALLPVLATARAFVRAFRRDVAGRAAPERPALLSASPWSDGAGPSRQTGWRR